MHQLIASQYGSPRGLTIHCTDCIVPNAGALARRTATSSPRASSYSFLIGLQGDLHQLCSILDRPWHAGRSASPASYIEIATKGTLKGKKVGTATAQRVARVWGKKQGRWIWPVVDGRAVQDPNQWGPGIEIMGKPGEPNDLQRTTLLGLVQALFVGTRITPDSVWAHGDLDPLNRRDPGFDVAAFAAEAFQWIGREQDGWDARGDENSP